MSVSVVQICNLALSHIGMNLINLLTEPTKEAQRCNLYYPIVRDFVLEDHPWGFASRKVDLALISKKPVGFDYAYQYPTDCLLAREIYQEIPGLKPIDFEVISQENLSIKMIITNQPDAVLIYTAKITDTNMFNPVFVNALTWLLASYLNKALTAKKSVGLEAYKIYESIRGRAELADATESSSSEEYSNTFIDARL